jgi:hypothetical protein
MVVVTHSLPLLMLLLMLMQWITYVWPKGNAGWAPSWTGPLIAATVLGSIAMSLLVFAVLLSWWVATSLGHPLLHLASTEQATLDLGDAA